MVVSSISPGTRYQQGSRLTCLKPGAHPDRHRLASARSLPRESQLHDEGYLQPPAILQKSGERLAQHCPWAVVQVPVDHLACQGLECTSCLNPVSSPLLILPSHLPHFHASSKWRGFQQVTSLLEPTVSSLSKQQYNIWDIPGAAVDRNLPANAGDMGSLSGIGRSHTPRSN